MVDHAGRWTGSPNHLVPRYRSIRAGPLSCCFLLEDVHRCSAAARCRSDPDARCAVLALRRQRRAFPRAFHLWRNKARKYRLHDRLAGERAFGEVPSLGNRGYLGQPILVQARSQSHGAASNLHREFDSLASEDPDEYDRWRNHIRIGCSTAPIRDDGWIRRSQAGNAKARKRTAPTAVQVADQRIRVVRAASGACRLRTPISSRTNRAASMNPRITCASTTPMQPTRKLSAEVSLPG